MPNHDHRSEKQKMLAGDLYRATGDDELAQDHLRADRLLRSYNSTGAGEPGRRLALLTELLGSVGEGTVVPPPFHCDYGSNIRLGARVRQLRLRLPRRGRHRGGRRLPDRHLRAGADRRPPARSGPARCGLRERQADPHRPQRLDRQRRDPVAGHHGRRRRYHRRGERGDAACAGGGDGGGNPARGR